MRGIFFITFIFFLAVSGCIYMPVNREPVYNVPRQWQPENKIRLGMSMEEVRERWGDPIKIIKSRSKQFDERWVYQSHWKCQERLDFKDGILIYGIKEE